MGQPAALEWLEMIYNQMDLFPNNHIVDMILSLKVAFCRREVPFKCSESEGTQGDRNNHVTDSNFKETFWYVCPQHTMQGQKYINLMKKNMSIITDSTAPSIFTSDCSHMKLRLGNWHSTINNKSPDLFEACHKATSRLAIWHSIQNKSRDPKFPVSQSYNGGERLGPPFTKQKYPQLPLPAKNIIFFPSSKQDCKGPDNTMLLLSITITTSVTLLFHTIKPSTWSLTLCKLLFAATTFDLMIWQRSAYSRGSFGLVGANVSRAVSELLTGYIFNAILSTNPC